MYRFDSIFCPKCFSLWIFNDFFIKGLNAPLIEFNNEIDLFEFEYLSAHFFLLDMGDIDAELRLSFKYDIDRLL